MIQDTDKLNPEEKLPSEIVTPKPENVTPERVTPKIESEADIDARLTQMLLAEAKADKERDEKRVQRQMAMRTLGDMGSVILDLVKGSEGARVDPRKVEQHYEKLDDDARKVYDAYRTRVDLLRKQQADRDKARAAQAAADERLRKELEARKEIADQNDEFKRWKTDQDNAAKIEQEQIRANAKVKTRTSASGEQEIIIPFAGEDYPIKKKVYDGRIAQLYAYLDKNKLFPNSSGASEELAAIAAWMNSDSQNSNAPESSKAKLSTAVNVALNYINVESEHAANIIAILQGTYGKQPKGTQQVAQRGQSQNQQSKTKKTITGVNGN